MPRTSSPRALLVAAVALALVLLVPTAYAAPEGAGTPTGEAAAKGKCAKYLKKAKRAKRGSAKQKKLKAKYRACKKKAKKRAGSKQGAGSPAPQVPTGPSVPASWLNRTWSCVQTSWGYDQSQPPFKFVLRGDGSWEDYTWGASQMKKARYSYDSTTLRLSSTTGSNLHFFTYERDGSGTYLRETDETSGGGDRLVCRE